MNTRIWNVTLVSEHELIPHCTIDICGEQIIAVHNKLLPQENYENYIDGTGFYAAPGFVDIHLHGGGGINFMGASADEVEQACMAHALHGTTTLLPTSVTDSLERTVAMIRSVHDAQKRIKTFTIAGVHLEGPFLSPAQCGAQNVDTMLKPTPDVLESLLGTWPGGVRIMGAAPEVDGGLELGKLLTEQGIVASIAHSNADYDTCCKAMEYGYCDITHIYSGCSSTHRVGGFRHGGVVEAGLLEDGFTVQVIADGCHLPPELLRLIVKCKGTGRISLITDALSQAGLNLPDGTEVTLPDGGKGILEDGVIKLPSRQAFAGSIATMDRLVRNMVQLAGVPLWDAVTMASTNPASVIGLSETKGRIAPGYDADIVLLDKNLQVHSVIARGQILK